MTEETVGASNRSGAHAAAGTPAESLGLPQPDADQLRADIEETRQELGDTVHALAAKADVKTRAEEGARRALLTARTRTTEFAEQAKKCGRRCCGPGHRW